MFNYVLKVTFWNKCLSLCEQYALRNNWFWIFFLGNSLLLAMEDRHKFMARRWRDRQKSTSLLPKNGLRHYRIKNEIRQIDGRNSNQLFYLLLDLSTLREIDNTFYLLLGSILFFLNFFIQVKFCNKNEFLENKINVILKLNHAF